MIKNIIFDMGGVLIRFDTHYFISRFNVGPEDEKLLMREVFRSVEWVKMDRGTLNDDEAAVIICKRLPEHLHDIARKLISMWDRPIIVVEGMEELIHELHDNGYKIYLLSNASSRQPDYWCKVPCSKYFEDTLVSYSYKLIKPQPEIYEATFKQFNILPEESLFIDDSPLNIEGAENAGLKGFVFNNDPDRLRTWLTDNGVSFK